jgi:NAD(P)-dependent dehydrogenase (short-subunit alcohol dehydrogenase family)
MEMERMQRFEGRRVLLTGAGSGIGQATTLRLLAEGAAVFATDISADGLAQTVERAAKDSATAEHTTVSDTTEQDNAAQDNAGTGGLGEQLATAVMDVSDEPSVRAVVGAAITRLGGLDVLVNAAGILRGAHTHDCGLDLWNQVLAVNLTGTFLVTREALPALLASERGVVVNFSSTSASFAHPYMAAYAASKGGVQSFTHSIALEYSRQGLRAACVVPGGIDSALTRNIAGHMPTDIDPKLFAKLRPAIGKGYGPPESVAAVVAMLASDDGTFITGTEIRIDGGTHQ